MLKACCECLTGSGVLGGAENEGSYGTQLNGGSESVPLRPVRSTARNMLVMPRTLSDGDYMEVNWTRNPSIYSFTVNLLTGSPSPDYNNIACQMETDFQSNQILLKIIQDGQTEVIPGSYQGRANGMMSGSAVKLGFRFEEKYGSNALSIFVNDSNLDMIELKHNIDQITFLEITGDAKVTSLAFTFA